MKGLREATAGLQLMDTDKIFAQGRAAYRFSLPGAELRNPMQRDTAHKIWNDGFKYEQVAFEAMLKRNGGSLGTRNSYAYPSR